MKEVLLRPDKPFFNNVDVAVIDFPQGRDGGERQRCKITVEFAQCDVDELKAKNMDFDAAMDYYKDWIYNVVKVNLSTDWKCVGGMDETMKIVQEHIERYFNRKR